MFIRVVHYEIKPGMMKEAEKVYNQWTKTILKAQMGFQNGYALVNSQTGIAMTVAVWASREDFDHFNTTDEGKEMASHVTPLLANPPIVAEFDRMIQV